MTLTPAQEEKLVEDVASILVALEGNGLGSSPGMIHRVTVLERSDEKTALEIRRLWQRWDRVKWTAAGAFFVIGAVAGAIGGYVGNLIPGGP